MRSTSLMPIIRGQNAHFAKYKGKSLINTSTKSLWTLMKPLSWIIDFSGVCYETYRTNLIRAALNLNLMEKNINPHEKLLMVSRNTSNANLAICQS